MSKPATDPLLAKFAADCPELFSALYDRFGQRLFRTAWGVLGRREDAEDAVQEVFIALVKSRHRLDDIEDVTAYLFTALHRAAGRLAKRRAKEPATSDEFVREAPACGCSREKSGVQSERLERALGMLPREQREAIAMKIDGELTFAEIAHVTDVSINTIASRYRYGLDKLRALLGDAS
jgi:RNA polymerase sigma-70 factor, ECF subfamily